ncbi:MAG: PLDc N-terminal domain-containing protein [Candidatus Nanoarchaeia archaeon]|nr:PLDc N-terminal domain-containing protein [Candidatus Nanoarchaeia archaeon]
MMLSNIFIFVLVAALLIFFLPMFFMHALWLAGALFWLWMLIDCVKRRFRKDSTKVIWILVIIFASFIGALIYFFFVKMARK